ncbi:MAG: DNA gyrase subunit A [Gammaproteobacteria bacterium]|nr:DNA gyrase subunit A [Gammaproteobacteria bacterium]
MVDFAKEVLQINIEEEMRQSYLDYAMSVIVGRALPDVRDGLKPVHRRILFSMHENNNSWNRPYVKCARVVGDVLGKYHPHGDTATYDALVRMAQDFAMRNPLIDGQGNFGSVDGDPPAAYRYTECRMTKLSTALLEDIEKETVEFVPNYDEKEKEPTVLPNRFPNLLVNGATGIAVGMATNIPPHNLAETVDGVLAMLDNPQISVAELMEYIPGPDFPTAGFINGADGIREAYETGRGRIYVRARCHIEEVPESGRQRIVTTEIPYQVNKARLQERVAELVKEKKLEGITEIRDESDKDGMRVVFELRRGEMAEVVLNNLYQHSQLQVVFGINMVALVDGQPRLLDLRALLDAFLRHRREVVTRRSVFELRKARDRAHILEGLAVALANIDDVIELIRTSRSRDEARERLVSTVWAPGEVAALLERADAESTRPDGLAEGMGFGEAGYRLSINQAQAILELRLHQLTALEQDKLFEEYRGIIGQIVDLLEILQNPDRMTQVIREELERVRDEYGNKRRTEIIDTHLRLSLEDLITEEEVVVTLSHAGYVKAQPAGVYSAQRRGGKGKIATSVKEADFVDKMFVANSHDTVLCFSSSGRVYWLKVYEFPQAGRSARGMPIVNLLQLEQGERIQTVLPVTDFDRPGYVLLATAKGIVKKTPLKDYSRPRSSGIIGIELMDDDALVGARITDGEQDIMLFSSDGMAIRFGEGQVRSMGRVSRGVRGMRLPAGQRIIAIIIPEEGDILTVTEHGYGKRSALEEFRAQGRGGQGLIAIKSSPRNGALVSAIQVGEDDEIMLISNAGTLVRIRAGEISRLGRITQGVRVMSMAKGEKLVAAERVVDEAEVDPAAGADVTPE